MPNDNKEQGAGLKKLKGDLGDLLSNLTSGVKKMASLNPDQLKSKKNK